MNHTNTRPTGELETPYVLAGQVWDERIGTARAQVTRWQMACGAMACIALLAVYGLIVQSRKAQVVAYIVEVAADGHVLDIRPALQHYEPTKAMMLGAARNFIHAVRGLPSDPIVARKQWFYAFGVATDKAKKLLGEQVAKHNLLDDLGKYVIDVEIQRVIFVSNTTIDLTWVETKYNEHRAVEDRKVYSGLVTTVVRQPKNEKEIVENPTGVWIDHFGWSVKE
jgi:type IV secretion system protein VirB5